MTFGALVGNLFEALVGFRTVAEVSSTAVAMIQLTSPAGQHGSEPKDPSLAEKTSRMENIVERNSIHEQKSSRNRPCDACRRHKSRCVLNEGLSKCVLCEFPAQDCTFIEMVSPRKRRYTSCEDELDMWLLT